MNQENTIINNMIDYILIYIVFITICVLTIMNFISVVNDKILRGNLLIYYRSLLIMILGIMFGLYAFYELILLLL